MHRTQKPVRKCHDCPLNLGDSCGVFDIPHDQWHNRDKCPGYRNEVMAAEFEADLVKRKADHGRGKRREEMKVCRSSPHYQGQRDPRRRAG